jgi:hypothetical protein
MKGNIFVSYRVNINKSVTVAQDHECHYIQSLSGNTRHRLNYVSNIQSIFLRACDLTAFRLTFYALEN